MASFRAALDYALRLHRGTGLRVRIFSEPAKTCQCTSSLGVHAEFHGREWYAKTIQPRFSNKTKL